MKKGVLLRKILHWGRETEFINTVRTGGDFAQEQDGSQWEGKY